MQAYDLFMLIVLGLAIVWGAWKGLAWQIASIASITLSYFVALNFRQPLANLITASPPWNIFLAMLILFLATGVVVWVGFNLVSEFIERVKLKEFDRQLGAVFGAAKGVLLCVLITLFAVALLGDPQRQAICNSRSGYYIAILLDRADAVIPKELHQVLGPYLDKFEKDVPHPHTAAGQSLPIGPFEFPLGAGSGQPATVTSRPSFSTGESVTSGSLFGQPPAAPAAETANRIEAQPVRPTRGSFQER